MVDFDAQPTQLKLQAHVDVLAALLSHEGATLGSLFSRLNVWNTYVHMTHATSQ